ncbi:hypothetical protein SAY86_020676 [Trapa natans]|uniref:RING-type domain-containing protein n=1 Tax=Trapa natans TaxID=22666 RepID=A0AAN7LP64_TRANT|nr:hypothetical protein SAY86_020676 [Trapa natans]
MISWIVGCGMGWIFSNLVEDFVFEGWVVATVDQLVDASDIVWDRQSNIYYESIQIDVTIEIENVIKPEQGSDSSLVQYFQELYQYKRSFAGRKVLVVHTYTSLMAELEDIVENNESCTICMEEYESDQEILKIGCSHYFHKECIYKWLRMNESCPLCRCEVTSEIFITYPPVIRDLL